MTTQLLKISGAGKRFGGLQALSDVTLSIQGGQIYGLIGPNGAGKTTLFNVITGLYQPDGGEFELNGHSYSPSSPHEVARAGIARTFQNIRLFGDMSALENVMVGRHVRTHQGIIGAVLRHRAARDEEAFGVVRMSNTDVLLLALANSTNSRTLAAMVPGDKIKV